MFTLFRDVVSLHCQADSVVGVTGRAENVTVLAGIQLFEHVAGRTEVKTGIEDGGIVVHGLADSGGHGKTAVGVDVDLADCALGGFAELILTDTDGVFQSAAVFVDDLDHVLRNAGGTVENDGESGDALLDLVEDVQTDFRIVAGLEFVSTVAGSDSDGKAVNAGAFDEVLDLFRTGVGVVLALDVVFDPGENTELTFDGDIVLVGELNDFAGTGNVLFVGQVAAVDHDRGETELDAALAGLEVRTVVEVQNDRNTLAAGQLLGVLDRALGEVAEQSLVGVFTRTLGDLEDHRRLGLAAGLQDSLHLLEVVEVVSGDGISAIDSLFEQVTGVDQSEFLVADHFQKPFLKIS